MSPEPLPVAVIGAGPVGLAAAAHLLSRGEVPLVLEAGARSAPPSAVGARPPLLPLALPRRRRRGRAAGEGRAGRRRIRTICPPAGSWSSEYLEPLAALPEIRRPSARHAGPRRHPPRLRQAARPTAATTAPFVLRVRTPAGDEQEVLARAVIDASGTYASPNPLGATAGPPAGSPRWRDRVFYGIPDVLGDPPRPLRRARAWRWSAAATPPPTRCSTWPRSRRRSPGRAITWIVGAPPPARVFGGGAGRALPARGELGHRRASCLGRRRRVALVVRAHRGPATRRRSGVVVHDEAGADPGRWSTSWSPPPASGPTWPRCASCGWTSTRRWRRRPPWPR